MKNPRQWNGAARCQFALGLLLILGIGIAAVAPSPRASNAARGPQVFYIAEGDYNTPLLGSYELLKGLTLETKCFSGFAGFEQHAGRYEMPAQVGIAQVTRFAGRLMEVAGIKFLARAPDAISAARPAFITEVFWRNRFGGAVDVLGSEVQIDGSVYRIAGITRAQHGIFASTDIWVPMLLRDPLSRMESLRMVGRLKEGESWARAQKDLDRCSRQFRRSFDLRSVVRMVPADGGISFEIHPLQVGGGEKLALGKS